MITDFEVKAYSALYVLAETEEDETLAANFRFIMDLASPEVAKAGTEQAKGVLSLADSLLKAMGL